MKTRTKMIIHQVTIFVQISENKNESENDFLKLQYLFKSVKTRMKVKMTHVVTLLLRLIFHRELDYNRFLERP